MRYGLARFDLTHSSSSTNKLLFATWIGLGVSRLPESQDQRPEGHRQGPAGAQLQSRSARRGSRERPQTRLEASRQARSTRGRTLSLPRWRRHLVNNNDNNLNNNIIIFNTMLSALLRQHRKEKQAATTTATTTFLADDAEALFNQYSGDDGYIDLYELSQLVAERLNIRWFINEDPAFVGLFELHHQVRRVMILLILLAYWSDFWFDMIWIDDLTSYLAFDLI